MDKVTQIDKFPANHFKTVCELKDYLRNARSLHQEVAIKIEGKPNTFLISVVPEIVPSVL